MAKKNTDPKDEIKKSVEEIKEKAKEITEDLDKEKTETLYGTAILPETVKKASTSAKKTTKKVKKEAGKIADDTKKTTKKTADKVKESAKEIAEDLGVDTDELKKDIKKGADKIKEGAKDLANDLDEGTKEFQQEAKSTANEFTQGAKDAYEELTGNQENKKILAGILAILFGALGIHKFILGYNKEGFIMLLVSLLTCGLGAMITSIIGLVEGIIYLTKSDDEFYQTYQVGKKTWF